MRLKKVTRSSFGSAGERTYRAVLVEAPEALLGMSIGKDGVFLMRALMRWNSSPCSNFAMAAVIIPKPPTEVGQVYPLSWSKTFVKQQLFFGLSLIPRLVPK
jgi:hypothetical protein